MTATSEKYHQGVKLLAKAEKAHRGNLDQLYQAKEARAGHQVTTLRIACEKSERALQDALQGASAAHKAYWSGRRDALLDELRAAAVMLAEFDALAHLAGDPPGAAKRFLQQIEIDGIDARNTLDQDVLIDEDGVPCEAPDCELLDDERGVWR